MDGVVLPDRERLAELCQRWKIRELSLFGSVARGEARPDSDVDLLVIFEPGGAPGLFEIEAMHRDFAALFGRRVDLVEDLAVVNPYRRAAISRDRTALYAA